MTPAFKDRQVYGNYGSQDANPAPFIVTTSSDKSNKATRKLIRSHVMRGKNSSKGTGARIVYGSWVNGPTSMKSVGIQKCEGTASWMPQPRILCRDLETFTFADQIKPYALDLIFKCKLSYAQTRLLSTQRLFPFSWPLLYRRMSFNL